MLTQAQLHQLFNYNPETGIFIKKKKSNLCKPCGWNNGKGYTKIGVNGKYYYAHRMAWVYVHGEVPDGDLDHINGNPSDNRICNLRVTNRSQNMQNTLKFKTNTSGYKGVTWLKKQKKWKAQITNNNHAISIGIYDSVEEAYEAYCQTARKLHTHNRVIEYV